MKRKAYSKIIYNGKEYHQAIVEYDDNGNINRVFEFTEEQPFTEWIGGTLTI
ncbi:MAG: hypothetical protein HUK06_07255 [Bacteroidaceae bacterium]|nr:hypothetical protein [Bacteroidaceae bacterium]